LIFSLLQNRLFGAIFRPFAAAVMQRLCAFLHKKARAAD